MVNLHWKFRKVRSFNYQFVYSFNPVQQRSYNILQGCSDVILILDVLLILNMLQSEIKQVDSLTEKKCNLFVIHGNAFITIKRLIYVWT